jgi:hypothetical protein
LNDTLPNTNPAAPVLLPFDVLQPQKILVPESPPIADTPSKLILLRDLRTYLQNYFGAETQADLLLVGTIPSATVPDLPEANLPVPRVVTMAPVHDSVSSSLLPIPAAPTASTLSSAPTENALRTRLQSGIQKPKFYSDGIVRFTNLTVSEEPRNLSDALTDPNWKSEMDMEFSAIVQNKT